MTHLACLAAIAPLPLFVPVSIGKSCRHRWLDPARHAITKRDIGSPPAWSGPCRALELVHLNHHANPAMAPIADNAPQGFRESFSTLARSRGERVVLLIVFVALLQLGLQLFENGELLLSAGVSGLFALVFLFATLVHFGVGVLRVRVLRKRSSEVEAQRGHRLAVFAAVQLGLGLFGLTFDTVWIWMQGGVKFIVEAPLPNAQLPADFTRQLMMLHSETTLLGLTGLGVLLALLASHRSYQNAALFQADSAPRQAPNESTPC